MWPMCVCVRALIRNQYIIYQFVKKKLSIIQITDVIIDICELKYPLKLKKKKKRTGQYQFIALIYFDNMAILAAV